MDKCIAMVLCGTWTIQSHTLLVSVLYQPILTFRYYFRYIDAYLKMDNVFSSFDIFSSNTQAIVEKQEIAEQPKVEITPEKNDWTLEEILKVTEQEELFMFEFNSYDMCKAPTFSQLPKIETIQMMQPYSVDVAISAFANWNYIEELISVMNFRSTIIIFDRHDMYKTTLDTNLSRKGFDKCFSEFIGDAYVVSYSRGYESFQQAINPLFPRDVLAMLIACQIEKDTIAYFDSHELVDIYQKAFAMGKNCILVCSMNEMEEVVEYLEKASPQQQQVKINETFQIQLF